MNLLEVALIFIVLLLVIIIYFSSKITHINKEMQSKVEQQAKTQFDAWIENQLGQVRNEIVESTRGLYEAKFQTWINSKEGEIRKDAISRSTNNLLGHIGEEFSPIYLSQNYSVALNDFRHLGSPVDFIAFKGLSDNSDPEIIFVEIKTGKTSTLQARERKVRDAVQNNKVRYEVVSMNDLIGDAKEKLKEEIETTYSHESNRTEVK